MNKKTLKDIIEDKYGSVDKMIEETNTEISRPYLYQLVNKTHNNPSKNVLKELSTLLDIPVEEVMELTDAEEA